MQYNSTLLDNETMQQQSRPGTILQMLTSASTAYTIDFMAMVQSLNENWFKTFRDMLEIVQIRILGLLMNPFLESFNVTKS